MNSSLHSALDFYLGERRIEGNETLDIRGARDGILEGITLSGEQMKITHLPVNQLMIKGAAGSGKSITLVSRMIKKMAESTRRNFLFVSFNYQLVMDARYRYNKSPVRAKLEALGNRIEFLTFHELAYQMLGRCGQEVPKFGTGHKNLYRHDDNMKAKMMILLDKLGGEEFKDCAPLHTIKRNKNIEFLMDEFSWMKGTGFVSLEDYLECERKGRGRLPRISVEQRKTVFKLFEEYLALQRQDFSNRIDKDDYALLILKNMERLNVEDLFDFIYVDEVQDLQPMQLKVLVDLCKEEFIMSGDDKQRVYKSSPFSYRDLGLDITNRNNIVLAKNWRSTYEIMKVANSLKFDKTSDDTKYENEKYFRKGGNKPEITASKSRRVMLDKVAEKIHVIYEDNPGSHIAVLHRYNNSGNEYSTKSYLSKHFKVRTSIQENVEKGSLYFIEAKAAKGLEFDYVFILDFDKNYYPHLEETIELEKKKQPTQSYKEDYEELLQKEKRILYVAMTRAKKELVLHYCYDRNAEIEISPFIKDIHNKDYVAKGFRKTLV
ncbi:3'-5' exonuclease [Halobacillus sp. SY10]|uniref:3'-5' exonuclease n=1 Tax=Halobacillus sp. SY10 TaxID=3381356 RepID=UPI00387A2DA7